MSYIECFLFWMGKHQSGFVALGVFIAAGASLFGAYWAARTSHKSRVSELRERWIERLREDVAQIMNYRNLVVELNNNQLTKEKYICEYGLLVSISRKIRLRLNENESNHKILSDYIYKYLNMDDFDEMGDLEKKIIDVSRKIFREEWKKAAEGKI